MRVLAAAMTQPVAPARAADRRDLVDIKRRMLAFGIEDRLAHLGRKQAVLLDFRRRYQTGHTELVEASHVAIEGRSAAPVSAARSAADWPKSTTGRISS
jgi:hypothetical protein